MSRVSVQALLLAASLIFAAIYLFTTNGLPRESITFPRLVLGALLVMGVVGLFGKQDRLRWHMIGDWLRNSKAPMLIGLMVIFLMLYQLIGFGVAALLFLLASFIIFGVKPLLALTYSVGTVAVLLFVFEYSLRVAVG